MVLYFLISDYIETFNSNKQFNVTIINQNFHLIFKHFTKVE